MSHIIEQLPACGPDTEKILKWIEQYGEDALLTRMEAGHFTAAGFIFNPKRTKTLMIYHNIFDSWAWTGGHADGDADFLHVALKEAEEEAGVVCRAIEPCACFADIIPVKAHMKRGKPVKEHVHLNLSFALECDEDAVLRIKPDENSGVAWLDIQTLAQHISPEDRHIMEIYRRIIEKYSPVCLSEA